MKYLLKNINKLKKDLCKKGIFLLLDFDGTLTPIVKHPAKAVLSESRKILLENLSNVPGIKLAIISGRGLNDIKKKVGIKDIIYAGNHGLEIESPAFELKSHVSSKHINLLEKLTDKFKNMFYGIKGIYIENKKITISIHYRIVSKKYIPMVKNIFNKVVQPYFLKKKIKIGHGKKVFEIKPAVRWNKGKAVLWLLNKFSVKKDIIPIYIGDDITDEDVFNVLRNRGITIFVGKSKLSKAMYYLNDTKEVAKMLEYILEIRKA